MNTKHGTLGGTTLAVFAVSFALPAYHELSGWACFRVCLDGVMSIDPDDLGFGLYAPAFVVANLVFVAVALLGLIRPRAVSRGWEWAGGLATGQVLSWPILNLVRADGDFAGIGPGYYLWLVAFLSLVVLVRRMRGEQANSNEGIAEATL